MGTKKEARGGQRGSGEKGYCAESGGECVPRAGTGRASQKCGWGRTGELRARLLWSTELPVRMGITVTRWTVG